MNYWIPVFTFGAAAAFFLALYFRAEKAYQKNTMMRRLTPQKTRRIERYPKTLFLRLLSLVGEKIMPENKEKLTKFSEKLARAGFKEPTILEIFYGLRGVCALTFGIAAVFFLSVSRGLSGQTIILTYGSMILGYYGPKWFFVDCLSMISQ